jgi:serine protease AprX
MGGWRRRGLLALALCLVLPGAASAAELHDGTAILQFKGRAAQARVVTAAKRLGLRGMTFRRLPFVAVRGGALQLRRLAAQRGIVAAHMAPRIHFDLYQSGKLVFESAATRESLYSGGVDGRGVNVAIVDGGVDGLHPDLENRIVRNVKVASDLGAGFLPPQYVECPSGTPCTSDTTAGHGTHVAGIIAGDGSASDGFYKGIAPGAGIVALGVGDGENILFAIEAYDWLLTHPELKVAAVNNSWGLSQSDGNYRYDSTDPINVATKMLHDAGTAAVWSAGNTSTGDRRDAQAGGSTCDTRAVGGAREAGDGICRFSIYGAAPWAIAVAAARKDEPGAGGDQHLATFSSRGDPETEISLDGRPVDYLPLITAPGVNIRAARNPASAASAASCGSAEPEACAVSPAPQYEALYMPLSGTSMAAPHVTGAIAVIQSAAEQALHRRLTVDEVKDVLVRSAAPMTGNDGWWDWPCAGWVAGVGAPWECGANGYHDPQDSVFPEYSGTPYQRYQVGAGMLDVAAAVRAVQAMQG